MSENIYTHGKFQQQHRLSLPVALSFSAALILLREGARLTRTAWEASRQSVRLVDRDGGVALIADPAGDDWSPTVEDLLACDWLDCGQAEVTLP